MNEHKKNVVFWIGVKSDNIELSKKGRYGDFKWMDYSKVTWQYWCKKNNVEFIEYNKPSNPDILNYRVTWQRYLDVFDYVESKVKNYDQIFLVDGSTMVKWNARNVFNYTDYKFCGFRGDENMNWLYDSINGYKDLFPDTEYDWNKTILGGFTIFNKNHIPFLNTFKEFFYKNYDVLLDKQLNKVKKGTDQPVLNWLIQRENIDIKIMCKSFALNHIYRFNLFKNNSLRKETYPLFVEHLDFWIFSGLPDRGDARTNLMSQTWDLVKSNYE